MKTYRRMPLAVEALFTCEGRLLPKRLQFAGETYEIERLISHRRFCPQTVACIAPIEFTVEIAGAYKKIYYEPDTGCWFSGKESDT